MPGLKQVHHIHDLVQLRAIAAVLPAPPRLACGVQDSGTHQSEGRDAGLVDVVPVVDGFQELLARGGDLALEMRICEQVLEFGEGSDGLGVEGARAVLQVG
jgi:hypothetical protein